MSIYISKEEDVLDLICFRTYGYAPGAMEAVLERNPFLADFLGFLPAGLEIILPDLSNTPQKNIVRIWS